MDIKIGGSPGVDYEVGVQSQTRVQNTEIVKQQSRLSEQLEIKVGADKTGNDKVDNDKADNDKAGNDKAGNDKEVLQAAEEMTKWVQTWNTDIQFAIHEETHQLMVQVVDMKEQRVLKEFPSREFLDTVAKIREYVGILLDKRI